MSKTNARTARTRAAILDTAWKLICDRGLEVRVADIAEAVGMTRQSIYVHFKTRGGLLMALVRRADERGDVHARFEAALEAPAPADRLAAFLGVWLDFVPKIHPVARQLIAASATDADARAAWQDRMDELRAGFHALAKSLRRDGALAPEWTAPQAADHLWVHSSVQVWALLAIDCGYGADKTARVMQRTLARAVLA